MAGTLKLKDLRAATAASVKAVVGKALPTKPGVLAGFWIDRADLRRLKVEPEALAKDVAKQVSVSSGIKVTAAVQPVKGGIIVGYLQPKILGK